MKFHIIVLGCQMNYSDSARIKAVLTNCGMNHVDSIDDADIVIFDTCSVRQKSEDKVFGKLLEIPKDKKIWLTGCMIQHNFRNAKIQNEAEGKKISGQMRLGNFIGGVSILDPQILGMTNDEIENLDSRKDDTDKIVFINHAYNPIFNQLQSNFSNLELFFRIDDTGFLPIILKKLGYEVKADIEVTNEYMGIIPHDSNQLLLENSKTAYVPISTGCSQFCAYCIVPYARGLEKNRPMEQILEEVDNHLNNGIEEIVLLGQIVNKHPDFVEICKKILKKDKLKWLRYTSPYPTFFPDELLELHEKEEKMAPHIHMPLQSGSDIILKKMFRGYTVEQFKGFIDKIRSLSRPISITTDIIIGFPGETDEDFAGSMEMAEYGRFDMIYMGIYSPRPGTLGARKYPDDIPRETKKLRRNEMNEFLKKISAENNQKEIGTHRTILVNAIHDDRIGGYADNMKNVIIKQKPLNFSGKLGEFVDVKIVGSEAFKLLGEVE